MQKKKLTKTRQEIHALYEANELADLRQRQTRARSVSVGTAGGGVIELIMRGDFANLWYHLQPTEAIELIGQLAAASGVDIAIRPRQDFAAWRSWDTSLPPTVQFMGAAPWQLTEEQRLELEAAKRKNITPINSDDELESN